VAASPALADASAGIFAILDEVRLEPSDVAPDRVRLIGVFVIPKPISSGEHLPPQRGELYFSANPVDPAASRSDWFALREAAGSGQVVAFAEYWMTGDPEPLLQNLPEASRERMRLQLASGTSSINTSLVVKLHSDQAPVLPEPYPRPNMRGVITRFDSEEQLCPRFGDSSSEIVASLWEAHDPTLARPGLPVCEARLGLIDGRDLDSEFGRQQRAEPWATTVETLLVQRVIDSGVDLASYDIECRFTICQLSFVFPSLAYQQSPGVTLSNGVIRDVPGMASGGKSEDARNGEPIRRYWIQRRSPD
jgi:hypothetical protein